LSNKQSNSNHACYLSRFVATVILVKSYCQFNQTAVLKPPRNETLVRFISIQYQILLPNLL